MPGYARKDIVRNGEIGTYHCWSRCVQKAYLCGIDPETNQDFGYRRGWIETLLAYLAGVFALDVGNYNVLTNHAHTILRTRPDIAATWSAEELALRWKLAWPDFIDGQWIREPTDQELDELLAVPAKIKQIRENLSSLSWFMARWKEPIAKLSNAEMERRGHFWESRFGSRELLDDEAVLTCSIYVDLNQLRAGLADSIEGSQYSAIRSRVLAAKCREAQASHEAFEKVDPAGFYAFSETEAEALFADCWLAPIGTDGPLLTAASLEVPCIVSSEPSEANREAPAEHEEPEDAVAAQVAVGDAESPDPHQADCEGAQEPSNGKTPRRRVLTRRRASDSPIIDVPWSEYLRVLLGVVRREELGTQVSAEANEGGGSQEKLAETLERWGMVPEPWLDSIDQLDQQCTRVLGTARHLMDRAHDVAQQWFHGIRRCREIFATPESDAFT